MAWEVKRAWIAGQLKRHWYSNWAGMWLLSPHIKWGGKQKSIAAPLWRASVAKPRTSKVVPLLVRAPCWLDPAVSARPTNGFVDPGNLPHPTAPSPSTPACLFTVSLQILSSGAPWHFSERSENLPAQLAKWCVKQLSSLITQRSAAIRSLYLLRMLCRTEAEVHASGSSEEKTMCSRPDLHTWIHFWLSFWCIWSWFSFIDWLSDFFYIFFFTLTVSFGDTLFTPGT